MLHSEQIVEWNQSTHAQVLCVVCNRRHLQVWAVVLGDKGAVALAQHCDLLLNVFDLVLGLLQVYNLDGHDLLGAIIDAFEHLAKRTLANPLQLGEQLLRIRFDILRWRREEGRQSRGGKRREGREEKKGMFEKNKTSGSKAKHQQGTIIREYMNSPSAALYMCVCVYT